jgi:uncharacterized protein
MKSQSRLWAISLVVFGSATALTAHPVHSQTALAQNSSLTMHSNRSTLKPGINRVTFRSEGETLVGNLYLPANYKSGNTPCHYLVVRSMYRVGSLVSMAADWVRLVG